MRRRFSAETIFLIISATFSFCFTLMAFISAIYRVETVGLNPLQLILLGTALEITTFIFEIPTGIVADLVSRRLSVIIGYTLIGAGFILEASVPIFLPVLLAQVVWGFGYTFISGALDAWLADERGVDGLTAVYLRTSQFGRMGALFAISAAILLARGGLHLPILIGGIGIVGLALFLTLFMPESGFKPVPSSERTTWGKMTATFRDGVGVVRGNALLMVVVGITLFFGFASEGRDRLWEAQMLENITFPSFGATDTVFWFAVIAVAGLLAGLVATEFIRRRVNTESQTAAIRVQFVLNTLVISAIVLFGMAQKFVVAATLIMLNGVFRGANQTIFGAWINKELTTQARATVLSMLGQIDAIGQIVGGILIGIFANMLGLRFAMIGVGLLLLPTLLLYRRAYRMTVRRDEVSAESDPVTLTTKR